MRMQLEGPDPEALLVRVRTEYGDRARIVAADRVRTGGLGGFFAKERFEVTVEVDDDEDTGPAAAPPPSPAAAAPAPQAGDVDQAAREAALLALAEQVSASERQRVEVSTQDTAFAQVLAGLSAGIGTGRPAQLDEPAAPAPFVPALPAAPAPAPAPVPSNVQVQVQVRAPQPAPVVAQVVERAPAPADPLAALPQPPAIPRAGGRLIAVVGVGWEAWESAQAVAALAKVDPRTIVVAAPPGRPKPPAQPGRRVTTPASVRRNRPTWLKSPKPVLVSVDAPLAGRPTPWVRHVIDELQPTVRLGVVSATTKPADVARWLGCTTPVDGLVLTNVDASCDPAAVLELGVPVAMLDGVRATRARWAAAMSRSLPALAAG